MNAILEGMILCNFSILNYYAQKNRKYFFITAEWEMRRDTQNRVYYINHNNRTTTWEMPQLVPVLPHG